MANLQVRIDSAKAAIELLRELASESEDPEVRVGVAKGSRRFADEVLGAILVESPEEPLSAMERQRFENSSCPYRKYEGTPWGEVPVEYIEFLVDAVLPLKRYLRSLQQSASPLDDEE